MERATFTTLKEGDKKPEWISGFRYPNETYSGCDMTVSLNMRIATGTDDNGARKYKYIYKILPEIQTLSYSVHMEKRPVRSIGNVNAKDYTMGPRTVAGSIVLSVFNKHFAKKLLEDVNKEFVGSSTFLVDELPPFDLVLTAANEYGFSSRLVIYGVRLLSEGQVMSVNDVYTENTFQFFATDVEYLNDEQKYTYKEKEKWYVLDDGMEYSAPTVNKVTHNGIYNSYNDPTSSWYEERQNYLAEKVFLAVNVKQPTKVGADGIATFLLDKVEVNTTGIIEVKNAQGKNFNINLTHAKGSPSKRSSKSLPAGKYTAIYKEHSSDGIKPRESNTEVFYVNSVDKLDPLAKWAPTIEWVTENGISIFCNEPLHNVVCIESSGGSHQYELINKRYIFKDLEPSTDYNIFTTHSEDGLPSSKVLVTTFDMGHKMFTEFEKYVLANSSKLVDSHTKYYLDLIAEAKAIAISEDQTSVEESLITIKDKHKKELDKLLDSNNASETAINEIRAKIKMMGELLFLSTKLSNNVTRSINTEFLETPELFYNERFDTCISFNKETSHAEFFRDYGNHTQFDDRVYSYMFKEIETKKNSFRFLGKQGVFHHADAYNKHIKAPALKFYIPTQEEKFDMMSKNNDAINKDKQDYVQSTILNQHKNISDDYYNRLFTNKLKEKIEASIEPPVVLSMNDGVEVDTSIFKMQSSSDVKKYNLCIATREEIINDKMIYKIPFTNKDINIKISKIFNGLIHSNIYSLWIEDLDGMQISKPTSLQYVPHGTHEDIKHLENINLFDQIRYISEEFLTSSLCEGIDTLLEFDETVNTINLSDKIMEIVSSASIKKNQLINFLKAFSINIGPRVNTTSNLIAQIEDEENITFECMADGITLVYANMAATRTTEGWNEAAGVNTLIRVKDLPDGLTYFYAVSGDLKKKSKLIVVNKFENYVEVI